MSNSYRIEEFDCPRRYILRTKASVTHCTLQWRFPLTLIGEMSSGTMFQSFRTCWRKLCDIRSSGIRWLVFWMPPS